MTNAKQYCLVLSVLLFVTTALTTLAEIPLWHPREILMFHVRARP